MMETFHILKISKTIIAQIVGSRVTYFPLDLLSLSVFFEVAKSVTQERIIGEERLGGNAHLRWKLGSVGCNEEADEKQFYGKCFYTPSFVYCRLSLSLSLPVSRFDQLRLKTFSMSGNLPNFSMAWTFTTTFIVADLPPHTKNLSNFLH